MESKEEIKKEVITRVDKFTSPLFESIEMQTEGSLTDDYYYMSLQNVKDSLNKCFEETYELTTKINNKIDVFDKLRSFGLTLDDASELSNWIEENFKLK